jgi:ariadne-1
LEVERKMKALQAQSSGDSALPWIDSEFLSAANEALIRCRQVLQYTYVTAYYLPEGPERTLFEFLQQQLESSTETLNELIEQPLESIDREQTVNFTRVTKQFLDNLIKGVREGLTNAKT